MPTPICDQQNPYTKNEMCYCVFCGKRNKCPVRGNQSSCLNCMEPVNECKEFYDIITPEIIKYIIGIEK